jgi:polygalacturonase
MKVFYSDCIKCFLFTLVANFCLLTNAATLPTIPSATFNITSYGASTSSTDNTSAIQQAINACNTAGGGHVVVPTGVFLCGPITLKSNVDMQISAGATLRLLPYGSGNGTPAGSYPNNGTTDTYANFIYAKNKSNIEVTGSGLIDGQGNDWWRAYETIPTMVRPITIRFDGCTNTAILGITLQNSPCINALFGKGCSNGVANNVTVINPASPTSHNTDGIDTWGKNIDITNCNISTGDDNIAMDDQSENITVKHCTFGIGHGCSIGSYTGLINNILVDSCSFTNTTAGIRLKTARGRGGVEQYITYSNITMSGVPNPVWITSYYPSTPTSPTADTAQAITSTTPSWQHITIKNVTATNCTNAGTLWGLPERSILDVVLDNVKISATTGMIANFVSGLTFKNGSTITATSGAALTPYSTTYSGINKTTGEFLDSPFVVTPSALDFGNGYISLSYSSLLSVSGLSLSPETGNVTITAPDGFLVGLTSTGTFSTTAQIPYTGGNLSAKDVYIHFLPTTEKAYADSISISDGTVTKKISVKGNALSMSNGVGVTVNFPLVSNATPTINGPVIALDETYAGMYLKNYASITTWPAGVAPVNVQRNDVTDGTTNGTWPAGETGINPNRYIQFAVKPNVGNTLTVDSIRLYAGVAGGSGMSFRVLYSKDAGFTNPVTLENRTSNASNTMVALSYNPIVQIAASEGFYLRFYPWYSATATSKYFCLSNLTFKGRVRSSISTGIENTQTTAITAYPNPSTGVYFLKSVGNNTTAEIYTQTGIMVKKQVMTNPMIDLSDCANGIYIVKLQSNQVTKSVLLVKK